MRQIWIPRYGDPHVLEVRDAPDPSPSEGQVRVKVEAAGVNFADLVARMGMYQDAPKGPIVVGYEVAGTIDAVGPGVDAARVGEPVAAMTRFGGYSSSVVVGEKQAIRRPDGMDAQTGAAIPVTYLTAWMMLEQHARIRAGDKVLVHSAGGGVGLAALDLIRWRGAVAYGTASKSKHDYLKERGYFRLVDYRTHDFATELAGEGFDVILDAVGGESWAKGLGLLRAGGKLIMFGLSGANPGETGSYLNMLSTLAQIPWLKLNPVALINGNLGIAGVNMGRMWHEADRCNHWLHEIFALWSQGVVRPVIHAAVPFDRAAEAHRILHARENVGKVLLIP
jgi:NADPH:quinone reductase-like Zn-dependent oxidoreductase